MAILILSLGSLAFIGVLLHQFQRLKWLYKTKQEPFLVVGNLFFFLMALSWVALLLTELLDAILGAAGTKMLSAPRLYSAELTCLRGCVFLLLVCGIYLFVVRLPTMAINRRRQRKELARLGWQIRKPKETLDVGDFKHLVIIGISLWKFGDLRGIESFQRYFQHDDWTVQVFFLDDCDWPADIQPFSPDVKAVWPTPIVSEYQDGVLVHLLSGKDALAWMKLA